MQLRKIRPIRAIKEKLADRKARKAERRALREEPAVIYDFDGTLADTLDVSEKIYNEIARERGYGEITQENIKALRSMSLREAAAELGVPFALIPILVASGRKRLFRRMGTIEACKGVDRAVRKLHGLGYFQAIATSNAKRNVLVFLEAREMKVFAAIVAGIGPLGKAPRLRRMLKVHRLDPKKTVYVGDELRDIEAAHAAGLRVVAVSWGVNTKDALARAQPEHLVDTPQELLRAIQEANS